MDIYGTARRGDQRLTLPTLPGAVPPGERPRAGAAIQRPVDLRNNQLFAHQLTEAKHTGNIDLNEAYEKIGPPNHGKLRQFDFY